jgi:SAM-dependent methyltransferase
MLKELLAHPLTRGLDLDDPRTTLLRRSIIQNKPFLRQLYAEWYAEMASAIPSGDAPTLELGSGAGFFAESIPGLITSDVFLIPDVSLVLDGQALPFRTASLRAIAMSEVLHHIPDVEQFFAEASRCVRPGGVIVMIEPWVTAWSRFVWGRLHHEPFQPDRTDWTIPSSGPLSGANGALPWIVFERDRNIFEERFPEWEIRSIRLNLPIRYLLSGGVSLRSLMPGWSFSFWRGLEHRLDRWMNTVGTFAKIVLVRRDVPPQN